MGGADSTPDLIAALRTALGPQYAVERLLGQGGMGSVFLARDLTLDRLVAVKVINADVASNATLRERFLQEARTVAKLRHPHIVPVHAAGESAGLLYFVMEFVPGESLRDLLAREHTLGGERAEQILRDIALALDHAHKQGMVHRDVKPENILLDAESGSAMLTDFGVSRAFEKDGGLTQTGMILGSPRYMSPEQASGDRAIDGRSDLYSLALVGYEMYTGAPVVQSGSVGGMLVKHLTETPAPLAEKAADVPAHVAAAIDRGLMKNPDERWQTGREFAEALAGRALSGTGERWSEPRAVQGARRASHRLRWIVAAGAIIAIALGSVLLGRSGSAGTAYLVAPFEIQSGEQSVAWLHDASVNMLTLTLGQWGDLQVVDYERTLSLLDKAGLGAKSRLSLDDAISLARRAKAGKVVTGQIQTIHDSLIVVAKLYDVASGKSKNQAQEAAPIGSDPRPLFDRLAQKLLQIAGGPTSTMQLAQATTTSIEAYRVYLNGVKLLNSWRLADADTAFAHAIDIDSTFALAYHKRSLGLGWSNGAARLDVADRAFALAGRLPPRERSLVEGHYHLVHALAISSANPADTAKANPEYRASIKAYSDLFARGDTLVAEAWYGQADAYYHGRLGDNPMRELVDYTTRSLRGFNKTLAIDSTFQLAFSHLVQIYNASAQGSNLLISGDSAIGVESEADVKRLGGPEVERRLRAASRAKGIEVARAWARADQSSTQAATQLAQSFLVAPSQPDSAMATLRTALAQPRAGAAAARVTLLGIETANGDTGLSATIRYIADKFTRDSLRSLPFNSRFAAEGGILEATATVGRSADLNKMADLALSSDSIVPGTTVSSVYIFDLYKNILHVAMGEPINDGMKRGLLAAVRGMDQLPAPVGDQARSGSISVPYLAYLASQDTVFLDPIRRWSKAPILELDALAALNRHDTATALKLAQKFPSPDSSLKAGARYSLGGMRGVARAEVLAGLGLTSQAVAVYDAMKPDHLIRSSLAEPGFAVWVRSLLAQARLLRQLGERDKAIAAYEEFIRRWKDADGVAAKQVADAKQELAQVRDSPKKH